MQEKLSQNKLAIVLSVVMILFIILIAGYIIYMLKFTSSNSQVNKPDESSIYVSVGKNKVIAEKDGSVLLEGTNIPDDLDYETLLPNFLPNTKIINVTDTQNPDTRIVLINYSIVNDYDVVLNWIFDNLTQKNWQSIEIDEEKNLITATMPEKSASITFNIEKLDEININVIIALKLQNV